MRTFGALDQLIGRTPLLELRRYLSALGGGARLLGKLECFNPSGSAKDRAALSMILDAETRGLLKPGATLIEPTSGNTGVALSWIAAARGYRALIVMPDSMSRERRDLMRAYGAELVLTDGAKGMAGAIEKAMHLARQIPESFMPDQFSNPANPQAHFSSTGPEIWEGTDGQVDIFVAGVGTGGTLSGAGNYLKSRNPAIQVVAVEPADSPVLSGGRPGAHAIQGIGAGFLPDTLDADVYDRVLVVESRDAMRTCRALVKTEGLLCGISSGAALYAATQLARNDENTGKTIVCVLPDTGDRYLSVPGFLEE